MPSAVAVEHHLVVEEVQLLLSCLLLGSTIGWVWRTHDGVDVTQHGRWMLAHWNRGENHEAAEKMIDASKHIHGIAQSMRQHQTQLPHGVYGTEPPPWTPQLV